MKVCELPLFEELASYFLLLSLSFLLNKIEYELTFYYSLSFLKAIKMDILGTPFETPLSHTQVYISEYTFSTYPNDGFDTMQNDRSLPTKVAPPGRLLVLHWAI